MKYREIQPLDLVAEDLIYGRDFYDQIEFGVGDYFTDSIISNLQSLKLYAGIHSKKFGYYRLLAKPFPFAIYYEIRDDIVVVVAVLDMRSDPARLRQTLSGRNDKDD